MSYPRYPEYEDSGVDWLGELPQHWSMKPLWTGYRRTKRTGFVNEELLSVYRDYGVIPKAARDDNFNKPSEDLSNYQLVEPSDLVINKMKAWQGSVAVSEHRGIVSPAYFVFESLHGQHDRFLHYLLRSPRYITGYLTNSKGIRVNQWDLEPTQHRVMPLVLPPAEEQEAIAAFLDRETAKIDALVAEQRRLIKLLKEKRQAVISHAVTKGLNPNAPLKPSGIPWLGDVPEHWTVTRVRRVIERIEQGWSPSCYSRPATDEEWGVVKSGCVNHGVFSEMANKALPEELEPQPEYEIRAGNVLMSRASGSPELVGSTALVKATRSKLLLSDKIFRLCLASIVDARFFVLSFNSQAMRSQIEQAISGAEGLANNLPQGSMKAFVFTYPPKAEQATIAEHVQSRLDDLRKLERSAEQVVGTLLERRTALISAAVTGKIDIRNAAGSTDAADVVSEVVAS